MRQGGGAGGSALSIWVRALAEGGEAAGEIKSDAAGHQSDWASGKITIVIFRSASGIAPPVPRRNVSQTGRVRLSAETANAGYFGAFRTRPAPELLATSQHWELSQPPRNYWRLSRATNSPRRPGRAGGPHFRRPEARRPAQFAYRPGAASLARSASSAV